MPLEAGLGAFSRRLEPTAVPALIKSSSSLSGSCLLRPQTLQATKATPARIIAPPTPTTTPMMVFLALLLNPLLAPEEPELKEGDEVPVEEVEDADDVEVSVVATPPMVVVRVIVVSVSLEGAAEVVDGGSDVVVVLAAAGSVVVEGGSNVEVDEDVLLEDVVDVVEDDDDDDLVGSAEVVGSADVAAVVWVAGSGAVVVGSLVEGAVAARVGERMSPRDDKPSLFSGSAVPDTVAAST